MDSYYLVKSKSENQWKINDEESEILGCQIKRTLLVNGEVISSKDWKTSSTISTKAFFEKTKQ